MNISIVLTQSIANALKDLFNSEISTEDLSLQPTRKEFEGTYTFVTFPFLKVSRMKPEDTGQAIGQHLFENSGLVKGFNVVKGFLNLEITDTAWIDTFNSIMALENIGVFAKNGRKVMVEYSSPNTNKPLHLGHLRNNFLGYSVSRIYETLGYDVVRVQIVNDRGIHICKSMVAWKKYGKDETPSSAGIKGDKLVGKYYVLFNEQFKKEVQKLRESGMEMAIAEKAAPILKEAQDMLLKWEEKDPETYQLWEKMNGWVYEGFEKTYKHMGVEFDKLYYESNTYLLGKEVVSEGLAKGIFFKKEDGSVWVDLTEEGLDRKVLLRSDGTAVYMTQDIGTAIERFNEFPGLEKLIYTVGNEQDYHFKVLFSILKKLGYTWANGCFHLSYGMVDLPSGKMKSREGTVVDADDLMDEMEATARQHTQELGKIEGFDDEQANALYKTVGLGALKYFLLKVDPKKRMLFNPEESIQFQGNTGPFIQYTYARISAIIRKAEELGFAHHNKVAPDAVLSYENEIIYLLSQFESKIKEAADDFSPSVIAQYVYDIAKEYNKFYQGISIFGEPNENIKFFRISLSKVVAKTIKHGMWLLGIDVPERM